MSYSRFGRTWPGGSPSWYIYHATDGGLAVHPGSDRLGREDVRYLASLLSDAYEGMEGDDWRATPEGETTLLDNFYTALEAWSDAAGRVAAASGADPPAMPADLIAAIDAINAQATVKGEEAAPDAIV